MEYLVILIGVLSVGCTFVLFMTISVHGKKISDVHKVLKKMHLKILNVESDVNVFKKQKSQPFRSRRNQSKENRSKREVIYKVPKKISGDLTMHHEGQSASVKATLKVKDAE